MSAVIIDPFLGVETSPAALSDGNLPRELRYGWSYWLTGARGNAGQ
jgi:hypothetical protein